jgi:hypothetical protein
MTTRHSTAAYSSLAADLQKQLAGSESATLYLSPDIEINVEQEQDLLLKGILAIFDVVRGCWAISKAPAEAVEAAEAAKATVSTPAA